MHANLIMCVKARQNCFRQWVVPDSDDFELTPVAGFEVDATEESANEGLSEAVSVYNLP
jgi:hypothetical protein